MTVDPFSRAVPSWIEAPDMQDGADSIILMSGVRVRRNIEGFSFPCRCGKSELYDSAAQALGGVGRGDGWEKCDFRMIDNLDGVARNLLLENRTITPLLAQGGPGRFLMRDSRSSVSCMINEEDHLSFDVKFAGLDLVRALGVAEALEGSIDANFVKDSVLGYLTANPIYVGTGVTAFALLHLPALDTLFEMPNVCDAFVRDWKKLALCRLLSEKNKEYGSFYLLSNKVTLAASPSDITSWVSDAAQSLMSKEMFARHKIRAAKDGEIDDRLWRAWGVLRYARKLSFNEAVNMFSLIKLGSDIGMLPYIYNREWKRMIVGTQRYHLAIARQGIIREQSEEARVRAARFRQFMEKKNSTVAVESFDRDKEL